MKSEKHPPIPTSPPPYYPPPSYAPPVIPPYSPQYAPPHATSPTRKTVALNTGSLPSHSAGSQVQDAATLPALSDGDSKQLGSIWQGPSSSATEDAVGR